MSKKSKAKPGAKKAPTKQAIVGAKPSPILPVVVAPVVAPALTQPRPVQVPAGTPLIRTSTTPHPTKLVWHIADEMLGKNPLVKRKDVIAECVRRGIAFYTARTQYQYWHTIQQQQKNKQ